MKSFFKWAGIFLLGIAAAYLTIPPRVAPNYRIIDAESTIIETNVPIICAPSQNFIPLLLRHEYDVVFSGTLNENSTIMAVLISRKTSSFIIMTTTKQDDLSISCIMAKGAIVPERTS